jgi:hypothetical protein
MLFVLGQTKWDMRILIPCGYNSTMQKAVESLLESALEALLETRTIK